MLKFVTRKEYNDLLRELAHKQQYIEQMEAGFSDLEAIMKESEGISGYHKNGDIFTWDELEDSLLGIALIEVKTKQQADVRRAQPIPFEQHPILYIKTYKHQPCIIAFTPAYGGTKYVACTTLQ